MIRRAFSHARPPIRRTGGRQGLFLPPENPILWSPTQHPDSDGLRQPRTYPAKAEREKR
jgi:hypothetical protein